MTVDEVRLDVGGGGIWLVNAMIALVMFGVALDLRASDFKQMVRSPKAPAVGLFAQYVLLPAFTFLLTLVLRPLPSITLGMILVASCPGGNLSNFLTNLAKGNTTLSVGMTVISTLAAIVMTPLNVTIWGNLHPDTAGIMREIHLDPGEVALTVFVIIGLPILAGVLFMWRFPKQAERLKAPFKYGSVFFFLAIIALVFSRNLDVFTGYVHWVALAVFLHNGGALLTGYLTARAARLSLRDRRAITIEVGIRNSALGITLILSFFGGLGGMALVAGAWGVWHIIAGLTLASLWSRQPLGEEAVEGDAA